MFAWSITIGVLITPFLMYVSFVYSIHRGFGLPAYLFPYAVIASPTMQRVYAFSIVLASIQFPVYGIVAGAAESPNSSACLICSVKRRRASSVDILSDDEGFGDDGALLLLDYLQLSTLLKDDTSSEAPDSFIEPRGDRAPSIPQLIPTSSSHVLVAANLRLLESPL